MSLLLLILVSVVALLAVLLALPVVAVGAVWSAMARWWRGPTPTGERLSPEALNASSPLVVAVHGTWASVDEGKAAWAQVGSPMQTALAEAIQRATGASPVWCAFNWTGDNSAGGRRKAVDALFMLVEQATSRHQRRFVLLVGHSHGGNIAATVAQRFTEPHQVRVVTLATPFLTLLERHGTAELGEVLTLLPGVAVALALMAVTRGMYQWPWLYVALAFIVVLVLGSLWAVHQRRQQQILVDVLRATTLDATRLDALRQRTFIVSRIGDEADGGLKLTAFAVNWIVGIMGGTTLVKMTGSDVTARGWLKRAWDFQRSHAGVTVDLLALLLGRFLLSLLQLVGGTSSGLVSVALNVGSSETPPGVWHHLQSTWLGTPGASLLSHSQIYDDQSVIAAVAEWAGAEAKARHLATEFGMPTLARE